MAHPRDILKSLGAAPLKSMSQNFLTSPHWAEKLVDAVTADSEAADEFWEIGPGLGALTQVLTKKTTKPIILFELDRKISQYLRGQYPQLELVEGDVLDANLEERAKGKKIYVLSNLPYQISSPILFKFAGLREFVPRLVFTFQKEFNDRLKAKVGDDLYGALSILIQLQFEMKSIGLIPPSAFYPEPGVDSEGVVFTPKVVSPDLLKAVIPVVKAAFLHPRKKMVNNLKGALPDRNWSEAILKTGKTDNARAEELSLEEFVQLCTP